MEESEGEEVIQVGKGRKAGKECRTEQKGRKMREGERGGGERGRSKGR